MTEFDELSMQVTVYESSTTLVLSTLKPLSGLLLLDHSRGVSSRSFLENTGKVELEAEVNRYESVGSLGE